MADAVSLALRPRVRRGDFAGENPSRGPAKTGYVFNRIELRHRLCRDVPASAHEVPGEAPSGTVHQDEAVAGAAACRMTGLGYAPGSVAWHDMAAAAGRAHDTLALAA